MSRGVRLAFVIALGLLVPETISADVLLAGRTGGTGMGLSLEGDQVTAI
jgi:hypothetical protein